MSLSNWIRWGALGALLAGIAWLASGLFSLVTGQGATELQSPYAELGTFSYYLLEILFSIALAGILAGLVGFHSRQAPNYGRLGTAGFFAAFVGVFFMLASTVASLLAESGDVLDWLFVLGFIGTLVDFCALRDGDLPGKGVAAVVWNRAPRRRLGYSGLLRLRELRWGDTLRSRLVGVGVRPLVGERSVG